jgi:Na+/melibiose symporter-like transporter
MKSDTHSLTVRTEKPDWLRIILMLLLVEKTVQHITVTLAFYYNWSDIRSDVVIEYHVLMISGAVVAVLFAITAWGIWRRRKWAPTLAIGLALFDIIGEFVAQGRIAILITVSFLVAIVLLIVAIHYRRSTRIVSGGDYGGTGTESS